jgi:hypothetical protein
MTIPRDLSNLAPGANTSGVLQPTKGGTGATTLTGYVKGSGTSAFTASSTVPTSDLTGTLGVSNGGTGAATLTANNVLLGNDTSAVQFVAPGTNGNVLTSNGTTWASTAPAGSTLVFLSSVFSNGASTVDLTGIDNTYDVIWITAVGVYFGTSTARLLMQVESGGSYQNTLYSYSSWATPSPNTTYSGFAVSTTSEIRVTENSYIGSTSSEPGSFDMTCYTPGSTTAQKTFTLKASVGSGSTVYPVFGAAKWRSSGAITAIRFLPSTGVIYGTFRMYGIKNS